MTDTPVEPVPAARLERIVAAAGNLARPAVIYSVGFATADAIHFVARKVEDGSDGAIFLGAVAAIVTIVVGARAIENINTARQAAKVDVAKVNAGSPPLD